MLRFDVVGEAFKKRPVDVAEPSCAPSGYFAINVFTKDRMQEYLPGDVFDSMVEVMENGAFVDRSLADKVAAGMKAWAMDKGATHYTHWFHPLTDTTAEKHDSFIEHDGHGGVIEQFSGKILAQQEPDASSFPSGGIRATFEARGYSAWDPTSPAFVIDDTLCIPTIFISYTGEALDYKAPLLKSLHAVDKAATAVSALFNPAYSKVTSYLGWEQEYFLVDEGLFAARPDLLLTGRTLMGHSSAKDQQLEDHYFGAIPERVAAFMKELEIEALKLGIPAKTCHNEAAPNQFELAPIFEETNLACDHNMLLMTIMKKVARRHGFRCLLHEKPFAGINGSGKHCNFSLQATGVDSDGKALSRNLMSPGKTPEDNLLFATFVVNTLAAVYKHNSLLKASIMSASNAHRLGGFEAPPAVISSFLGSQISALLDALENSSEDEALRIAGKSGRRMLDMPQIPELLIDNTDRNRTSPFAFTGNRFEFRAVGSEANCACAMIALNSAVAAQLQDFKSAVDARIAGGTELRDAIIDEVRSLITYSKPVRFDGNGYSAEWLEEAARRGLDCESSAPEIFKAYNSESSVAMFEQVGVMNRAELYARTGIKWEIYVKKIQIEARVFGDLAINHIIPVATLYQSRLADNVFKMSQILGPEGVSLSSSNIDLIRRIAADVREIEIGVEEMIECRKVANRCTDLYERAVLYHDTVVPKLEKIRTFIDRLEEVVDDSMWPLPKYRELLFIR